MEDAEFKQANSVLTGHLRDNKGKGLDVSQPRQPIEKEDMEKLFNEYFKKGMESNPVDTEVLLHKVFFDILYYTGCRGKEGLRALDKKLFDVRKGPDGKEYFVITFNEKTKKNQGDAGSTSVKSLHNNPHHVSSQPDNILCPVDSFKTYAALLNHECSVFFQYPNKEKSGFTKAAIGKNSIGDLMKEISKKANLSKIYTNHQIRKTTATALYRSGFDLKHVANVTKHKNLDSLKHYVAGPTYKDKENYNSALLQYAQEDEDENATPDPPPPKRKSTKSKQSKKFKKVENVPKEKCTVQMYPESDPNNESSEEDSEKSGESPNKDNALVPTQSMQNVVQNQLRQASNMFSNARFANCNFTFTLPK